MLTQITDRIPPLYILIPVLLTVWAVSCTVLHGPAILAYVAIQAATSGVFALSMYRISRRHTGSTTKPASHATKGGSSQPAQNSDRHVTV